MYFWSYIDIFLQFKPPRYDLTVIRYHSWHKLALITLNKLMISAQQLSPTHSSELMNRLCRLHLGLLLGLLWLFQLPDTIFQNQDGFLSEALGVPLPLFSIGVMSVWPSVTFMHHTLCRHAQASPSSAGHDDDDDDDDDGDLIDFPQVFVP